MSVSGRTVWWAKDAGWYRRSAVIKLKRKYGPLGLVVVDWLTCEAKSQDDGGWVKSGVEAIADGIGSDDVQVRPVLSDASDFGLLDDYEDGGETFTCRISGWHEEQERVADAQRKRAERAVARKKPLKPDPPETERPVSSDSVQERPEMSPTGQDRTGQKDSPAVPTAVVAKPKLAAVKGNGEDSLSRTVDDVVGILQRGIDSIQGDERCKPPTAAAVREALTESPVSHDTAVEVASEVRAIALSQNRAPNIVGLYRQKLSPRSIGRVA